MTVHKLPILFSDKREVTALEGGRGGQRQPDWGLPREGSGTGHCNISTGYHQTAPAQPRCIDNRPEATGKRNTKTAFTRPGCCQPTLP